MSLYELQEWLGHRLPSSTQRYAKITPMKLMKSYSDAGYFGRNLRAIEVLIDQEKVRAGMGAQEAWKFYDLGHGYCNPGALCSDRKNGEFCTVVPCLALLRVGP
jgi:hypothetical protein